MLHILTLSTLLVASDPAPSVPQQTQHGARNVAILVFDGVELLDFAGPGQVFAVSESGAFDVFTVAETKSPLTSEGFLTIVPEYSIDDCPEPDILVIPGGNVPASNERLQTWISGRLGKSELVMSVCNGAALLAAAGGLKELEATTHHNTFDQVYAFAPDAKLLVNRRFVDHGEIMSTGGISAGIDGSLHVVSRLLGEHAAQATATHMEYDWRPEEIAALHATDGIRYDRQAEHVLEAARQEGTLAAAASYAKRVRAQSETDRTEPSERRLRSIANGLIDADRMDDAITVLEYTIAAWNFETAKLGLKEARELAEAKAAGTVELVYSCPPCGRDCDSEEFAEPSNCSSCGMALARRMVASKPPAASAERDEEPSPFYVCPPCGQECDGEEHAEPGTCSDCNMTLRRSDQHANGGPVVSPSGRELAYWSDRTGTRAIYVSAIDGSAERLVGAGLEKSGYPSWSPDGTRLAFNEYGASESRLWIVDVASGERTRVPVEGWSISPTWSPDGSRLAYAHGESPRPIVVSRIDGTERIVLDADGMGNAANPDWCPAGDHVAFETRTSGDGAPDQLWIADVEGGEARRLTEGRAPAWSPDSTRIAFERSTEGRRSLFSIAVDGSDLVQLTDGASDDRSPAWSHDGVQIYFASDRGESIDLWIVDADGSNVRPVRGERVARVDAAD